MGTSNANRMKPNTVLSGTINYQGVGPVGTVEFSMDAELFERRELDVLKADLDLVVQAHCPAAQVVHWRIINRFSEGDEFYDRKRPL